MHLQAFVVRHEDQRYPTVGDWFIVTPNRIEVKVSEMGNEDYEFLVAMHEFIEAYLCNKHNILEEEVNAFDIKFEQERPENNFDEPGNHPAAPYHREHKIATKVERLLAECMGVDWEEYDNAVNSL